MPMAIPRSRASSPSAAARTRARACVRRGEAAAGVVALLVKLTQSTFLQPFSK